MALSLLASSLSRRRVFPQWNPVSSTYRQLRLLSDAPAPVQHKRLTVALVGRPNTGKSTLFNRLTRSKGAIVSNVPGTTRDRKEGAGHLAGQEFKVFDTGGFDDRGLINIDIQKQVQMALHNSNIVLFMIDTRTGVTALDSQFAQWIRKQSGKRPDLNVRLPDIILVANKAEGGHLTDQFMDVMAEGYRLGFGEPILISAAQGDGMTDIASKIMEYAEKHGYDDNGRLIVKSAMKAAGDFTAPSSAEDKHFALSEAELTPAIEESPNEPPDIIQLAVMGRPNVGKSTLINAVIGEERVITGPLPGLTRDAITVEWEYEERKFKLVDTAGLTRITTNRSLLEGIKEKKLLPIQDIIGKVAADFPSPLPGLKMVNTEEDPSQYSSQISEFALVSALNALRFAQVVMLVVEGGTGKFMKIDLQLARKCLQEGRALFIVANKFDLVKNKGLTIADYESQVKAHADEYLREFGDIPVCVTTGSEGAGLKHLLRTAIRVYDSWDRRIETWVLNNWLKDTMVSVPTARAGDKAIKIKYVTQVKARPPTFALFTNVKELPQSFERFLRGRLQDDFKLRGVPIRFVVKRSVGKAADPSLLRQGKHTRRGVGKGDNKGRVGPNRLKKRLVKKIRGTTLKRRKMDKRMHKKK